MNKRQRKKLNKKLINFETFLTLGYKEYKSLNRGYHEYCVSCKRYRNIHKDDKNNWLEE